MFLKQTEASFQLQKPFDTYMKVHNYYYSAGINCTVARFKYDNLQVYNVLYIYNIIYYIY